MFVSGSDFRDARLTTQPVKHVPGWFPGTGFKQFAEVGRKLFDVAVDGPLDYVKESLKVRLSISCISILKVTARKANGNNVSIAATCFDRVVEPEYQEDENVIRAVTGTMYIGEISCRSCVLWC